MWDVVSPEYFAADVAVFALLAGFAADLRTA
jgi:hypothetical protein